MLAQLLAKEHVIQPLDLSTIRHIHFIGIGGVGMSGIAELLQSAGYRVSGSDVKRNPLVVRLESLGVQIYLNHSQANIKNAEIVVVSSAIDENNPELMEARRRCLPVLARAEMLAHLMQLKTGIAIAGTHGKTSTTSMTASVFTEAGLDPTYVIGGILQSAGRNSFLGQGKYFIAEADESDASFLFLNPFVSIVTNIDADHLSTYNHDFEQLKQSFFEFIHRLQPNGLAILCADDAHLTQMFPDIKVPYVTYGYVDHAMVQLIDYHPHDTRSAFTIHDKRDGMKIDLVLNMPGRHYAANAAAAYIAAKHFNIPVVIAYQALSQFKGVGRRFQIYGEYKVPQGKFLHVDDYGHHPKEIEVTLNAAKDAWPGRRIVLVHQPHRYTRVQELFRNFIRVFSEPDVCILLDIYSAGEKPIAGISGENLYQAVKQIREDKPTYFVKQMEALPQTLKNVIQNHDVLLTQGAGSIGLFAENLANLIKA